MWRALEPSIGQKTRRFDALDLPNEVTAKLDSEFTMEAIDSSKSHGNRGKHNRDTLWIFAADD